MLMLLLLTHACCQLLVSIACMTQHSLCRGFPMTTLTRLLLRQELALLTVLVPTRRLSGEWPHSCNQRCPR